MGTQSPLSRAGNANSGARVVLVGHHEDRLARFAGGAFRHAIHARHADWIRTVRNLAPGGVQVAVDTVGSIQAVEGLKSRLNTRSSTPRWITEIRCSGTLG